MGRPRGNEPELGRQVLKQREDGVPWKQICRETGYGRTRLWQLMKIARFQRDRDAVVIQKDVHEHLRSGQARARGSYDGRERRQARLLGRIER